MGLWNNWCTLFACARPKFNPLTPNTAWTCEHCQVQPDRSPGYPYHYRTQKSLHPQALALPYPAWLAEYHQKWTQATEHCFKNFIKIQWSMSDSQQNNIHITWIAEREQRNVFSKNISYFKKIMAEKFPNLGKETDMRQRKHIVPNEMNPTIQKNLNKIQEESLREKESTNKIRTGRCNGS